jgi:alkylation response protein AidB-like acyl-CoA dehydrogenase
MVCATAGSDVAGITTTAERRGDKYVVNGAKKWITNGVYADYCTAAVRTGGDGKAGVSALIIPLKTKGVMCRKMENSGVAASGKSLLVVHRSSRLQLTWRARRINVHRVRRRRGADQQSARQGEPWV